jgi:hypothetical protein
MHARLEGTGLADDSRATFHFALGKAHEDAGQYAEAFRNYELGNELRLAKLGYDPDITTRYVRRSKALLTRQFFTERAGYGSPAPDPIFIVGLPRAGSTLIEQILASHSRVEGTMELPNIMSMVTQLREQAKTTGSGIAYPELLASLSPDACRELGEQYLNETRIQRRTDKPFFIDKMPNNFLHIGMIRLALPNAKIIDARRHPMACCFSGFKQNFAHGQRFSYNLTHLARHYRDYVELMAHFDTALPGAIHRIIYEDMVDRTEAIVRSLLTYCGLPYEGECLRFHENERAVRTASAQQVRRPIYRDGVDQWRHFADWLTPLEEALGDVLLHYPHTPQYQNA